MIPDDHLDKLLDLAYAIKNQKTAYDKTPIIAKSDDKFADEIDKIANQIKNWSDDTRIRKW